MKRYVVRWLAVSISAVAFATAAWAQAADDVRKAFARQIYDAWPTAVHDNAPQPLLRAVVVLRVYLGDDGRWTAEVFRDNPNQPELTRKALESIARLPQPRDLAQEVADELHRIGFVEAWLFENDGRFALRGVAKPQRAE